MQASGAMGGLADAAAGEEGAYDGDADARSALNLYFAASAGRTTLDPVWRLAAQR